MWGLPSARTPVERVLSNQASLLLEEKDEGKA